MDRMEPLETHAIATGIATQIKTILTQPTLAQGVVRCNPINANRFSLQTGDEVPYNLTSAGASPFTFPNRRINRYVRWIL